MRSKLVTLRLMAIFLYIFSGSLLIADNKSLEDMFIAHVKQSIENADKGLSKLSPEVLEIEGMSSTKVRNLLNNLCSMPETSYLEIGLWKGSTWVAALYNNQFSISSAVGIDNWSQFFDPQETVSEKFSKNCAAFLPGFSQYRVYTENCFRMNIQNLARKPITVYFYDGNHSASSQELAFTYFNPILDGVFVAVVDDWQAGQDIQMGTRRAFKKLNYEVLFEAELLGREWWNGLYVAVVKKR